jgi:hypothetical protein
VLEVANVPQQQDASTIGDAYWSNSKPILDAIANAHHYLVNPWLEAMTVQKLIDGFPTTPDAAPTRDKDIHVCPNT